MSPVTWVGVEASYTEAELAFMAELRPVAGRDELEVIHLFKALFDGELSCED